MNRNITFVVALGATLMLACAQPAAAGISQDLANAIIIEEFLFDDPNGTQIPAAANNAGTGHLFDTDTGSFGDANADVVTNGSGQLVVSLKNNTEFGTNYVDNDNIANGRLLAVMELTWDFQSTFVSTADEEIRLNLINNDPRGTQVTAQVEIQRTGTSAININGVASTAALGASNIADFALNITQTAKFIAVLDADLTNDVYSIHFSDNAGSTFTTTGSGTLAPLRIANALRFVLNEDFVGDNVLIDRVYLARIPEPSSIVFAVLGIVGLAAGRRRQ